MKGCPLQVILAALLAVDCASMHVVEAGETIRATFLPDASQERVSGRLVAVDADSFRLAPDDGNGKVQFARREVAKLEVEDSTLRNALRAFFCTGIGFGLASLFFDEPETGQEWVGYGVGMAILVPACIRPHAWRSAVFPLGGTAEEASSKDTVGEQ